MTRSKIAKRVDYTDEQLPVFVELRCKNRQTRDCLKQQIRGESKANFAESQKLIIQKEVAIQTKMENYSLCKHKYIHVDYEYILSKQGKVTLEKQK